MAKEITGYIKLQIPAGKANPAPPIGPALGQAGLNIMEFCKQFNAQTQKTEPGTPIPVVITAYKDRSFTFIMKQPPVAYFLMKAAGIAKGTGTTGKELVGKVTKKQIEEIAKVKMVDMNGARYRRGLPHDRGFRCFDGHSSCGGRVMATKSGKRIKAARAKIDANKNYALKDAVTLLKEGAPKFNQSVDVAINLGIDPTQSDQLVRGMVPMPHGLGKTVRVAVFAKGDKAELAKKAGADLVGGDEIADAVMKGEINFDVCIATPDMMGTVGKIGKILGPRGLMPNPKLGTVTPDVEKAVKAAKAGQVEFKVEKSGIVHAGVGKVGFTEAQITDNIKSLIDAVSKAKPSGVKGNYIKRISISATMGPGIKLDLADVLTTAA